MLLVNIHLQLLQQPTSCLDNGQTSYHLYSKYLMLPLDVHFPVSFITHLFQIYVYSGICLGFGLLAMILMATLLDNLKTQQTKSSSRKLLTETLRHFWHSGYQKLLVSVTIYRGLSPSFLIGDFNAVSHLALYHFN